jgi:hypothetical protein
MQENASTATPLRRQTAKEERQAHVDNWKKSGLSMSEYCRQNNLSLASLSDWKRSILRKSTQFKSVQPLSQQASLTKFENVVEIIVGTNIKMRIQHVTDASLVINIVKGILICNS